MKVLTMNNKKTVSFPMSAEDLNEAIEALRNQRDANVDEAFKETNLRIDDLLARFSTAKQSLLE